MSHYIEIMVYGMKRTEEGGGTCVNFRHEIDFYDIMVTKRDSETEDIIETLEEYDDMTENQMNAKWCELVERYPDANQDSWPN